MADEARRFDVPLLPNENKSKIPRSFYNRWGQELGDLVDFMDPNGRKTKFTIIHAHGRPFFAGGITSFREYYRVYGFVLFTMIYQGNGCFHFRARDKWMNEIEYVNVEESETIILESNPEIGSEISTDELLRQHGLEGFKFSWSVKLTSAQASGRQTLCIPSHVVQDAIGRRQQFIDMLIDEGPTRRQQWRLHWADRRPNQCALGRGWYEYCRENALRKDDELIFCYNEEQDIFTVGINRPSI